MRGFASRCVNRKKEAEAWFLGRQSKRASFEKARGHSRRPYVAITREKRCAHVSDDIRGMKEEEKARSKRNGKRPGIRRN